MERAQNVLGELHRKMQFFFCLYRKIKELLKVELIKYQQGFQWLFFLEIFTFVMTYVVDGDSLDDIYSILFDCKGQQRITDINMIIKNRDAVNKYINKAFCSIKLMLFKKLFSFNRASTFLVSMVGVLE